MDSSSRSTSTTSGLSDSGSDFVSAAELLNCHIGDIDELLSFDLPREHTSVSSSSTRTSSNTIQVSNESNEHRHDDSASTSSSCTYDSLMEEIRKEVWEQVQNDKKKRLQRQQQQQQEEEEQHIDVVTTTDLSEATTEMQEPPSLSSVSGFGRDPPGKKPHEGEVVEQALRSSDMRISAETSSKVSESGTEMLEQREMDETITQPQDDSANADLSNNAVLDMSTVSNDGEMTYLKNIYEMSVDDFMSRPPIVASRGEKENVELSTNFRSLQELMDNEADSLFDSILAIDLEEESPTKSADTSFDSPHKHVPGLLPEQHTFDQADVYLKAIIHGSREETMLYIPFSYVEKREMEMMKRAIVTGINPSQWKGSLLCQEIWSNKDAPKHMDEGVSVFELDLYPEKDCAEANYSQSFVWQSWLNECVESFYKTGKMHIPDFCLGSELLVALQYFGILYNPEHLSFDSFNTFLRVKLWSEYFSHRTTIGSWIAEKLEEGSDKKERRTFVFSTYPYVPREGCTLGAGSRETQLFDGGISLNPTIYGSAKSSMVVYSFFNEDESEAENPSNIDVQMREDFCDYLERIVPGVSTSFPMKLSTIRHPNGKCEEIDLATLYVRLSAEPAPQDAATVPKAQPRYENPNDSMGTLTTTKTDSDETPSKTPRSSILQSAFGRCLPNVTDGDCLLMGEDIQLDSEVNWQLNSDAEKPISSWASFADFEDPTILDALTTNKVTNDNTATVQQEKKKTSKSPRKVTFKNWEKKNTHTGASIVERHEIKVTNVADSEATDKPQPGSHRILPKKVAPQKQRRTKQISMPYPLKKTVLLEAASKVEHIYEELLLQDTEFFDDWEDQVANDALGRTSKTKSCSVPASQTSDFVCNIEDTLYPEQESRDTPTYIASPEAEIVTPPNQPISRRGMQRLRNKPTPKRLGAIFEQEIRNASGTKSDSGKQEDKVTPQKDSSGDWVAFTPNAKLFPKSDLVPGVDFPDDEKL